MTSSIHTPTLTQIKEIDERNASLTVAPLYSGYGHTLGNSIRRVMLSNISGAAIVAVKISGTNHEYTAIDGVMEDVLQIIQNLKNISFRSYSDKPVTIKINKKTSGPITAADFEQNSEVEIANPELVIATTAKNMDFSLEAIVQVGRGYKVADEQEGVPSDYIKIDSIFSPVERVRYKVQPTRVGQNTDLDEVVLTIQTDGSITPSEAFEEANAILAAQYSALAGSTTVEDAGTLTKQLEEEEGNSELRVSIEDLGLSARTTNALINNEIKTLGDLAALTNTELKELKGFGSKALDEVKEKLVEINSEG